MSRARVIVLDSGMLWCRRQHRIPWAKAVPLYTLLAFVVPTDAGAGACEILDLLYANKTQQAEWCPALRAVSVQGRQRGVSVWWDGRAPSRAAAALLLAALRHGLRYRGLRLRRARSSFCDFVRQLPYNCEDDNGDYDDVAVIPSAVQCDAINICEEADGVSRLRPVGAGAAPATLHLHVYLVEHARKQPLCMDALHWTFFENSTAIELCSFQMITNHTALQKHAVVFTSEELVTRAQELADIIPLLTIKSLQTESRHFLFNLLRSNMSFLFLDYDIWADAQNIQIVESPPISLFEPICTLRYTNAKLLKQFAPQLYEVALHFAPTANELRIVLELEANHTDSNITEAACNWAIKNKVKFDSWLETARKFRPQYWIAVFMCKDYEDIKQYKRVAQRVINVITSKHTRIKLKLEVIEDIDCTSEHDLKVKLLKFREQSKWTEMIGALATGAGVKGAAYVATEIDTALVLYDTPTPDINPGNSTRIVGGLLTDLVFALQQILLNCNWRRLAVLSDGTHLASVYIDTLLENSTLAIRNITLKMNTSLSEIRDHLQILQKDKARIFFVNTDAKTATLILCEALHLDMTRDTGHIWILREWHAKNYTCVDSSKQYKVMKHFTISYWWRGGTIKTNYFNGNDNEMLQALNELWEEGSVWPRLAAPLADGLILLINSFYTFVERCNRNLQDLHGDGTTGLLWTNLNKQVYGIAQELHPKKYTYVNPVIFVDEWHGAVRRPIVAWQIGKDRNNRRNACFICSEETLSDGSKYCLTTSSNKDEFSPHCHDNAWIIATVTFTFGVLALYKTQRLRATLFKQSISRPLGARENVSALAEYLVDRTALEFHQDLGYGRFGRVQFAILRTPNRSTVVVAVKSLHENSVPAEETEFLREACILASLRHKNVVRLIGVCAMDGPPLVLMEHAFFGDLLRYLRERRHLIEHVHDEVPEEATHVSARALTRLAREASSALAYLTQRRLVHRDVRASNCLIDARRSLKLADFGMARETTSKDGVAEYTCRRRGFFPVLWMAPESLDRGVFSAATDIWALGVLILELVTLGKRPYGAWPLQRVLHYVIAGGRPPLPLDSSLKTRGLLLSCWRRVTDHRPTAAEITAYLEANPLALSPALETATLSLEDTVIDRFDFIEKE